MNWSDLVVVILVLGIVGTEMKRGFGMALFTFGGALLSLKLASLWSVPLSKSLHLNAQPGPNQALVFYALFVLLVGVTQVITYLLHPDTFLSMDPWDNFLGGAFGLCTGWAVAYAFYLGIRTWGAIDLVNNSRFALEVMEFRTYYHVVTLMRNIGVNNQDQFNQ